MNRRDALKAATALATLSIVGGISGCGAAQWLANLEKFLPVLLQIALNVAQVVAVANHTGVVDHTLSAEMKAIFDEVKSDLTLLQTLAGQYSTAATPGNFDKIEATLNLIQRNLQAIFTAFHVKDLTLQTLVATSIGAALSTVMAILALMPAPTTTAGAFGTRTTTTGRTRITAKSSKAESVLLAVAQEAFAQGGQNFQ